MAGDAHLRSRLIFNGCEAAHRPLFTVHTSPGAVFCAGDAHSVACFMLQQYFVKSYTPGMACGREHSSLSRASG